MKALHYTIGILVGSLYPIQGFLDDIISGGKDSDFDCHEYCAGKGFSQAEVFGIAPGCLANCAGLRAG